ncbi:MAG: outer membrane lipoprotein chaperone LolA [Cocleimonas sp.]
MKKTGLLLSLASLILMTSSSLTMAAPDEARQRLNNFFTGVTSLKGSFSQQVFSRKGKMIQSSTGDIALSRPGKFRWVYKTPDPQTIVGNGKNIWVYDEDLEQVTIKPMSSALASAPIAILTRKQSADAQFHVQPISHNAAGLDWFKLTPRKQSKDFRFIEIGLDKQGMRQMIMHDQLGQKTVIQLNAKTNVPIKGSTFFFKIPQGVDVIGKAS